MTPCGRSSGCRRRTGSPSTTSTRPISAAIRASATSAPAAPATGATSSTSAPSAPHAYPVPGEPAYWWLEGPNQWPAALPELRSAALTWIDRLSAVAEKLLHELLAAIGAPEDFYDDVFGDRAHPHLKLVRYPGSAEDGTAQGVGAHKDYGFLTLLHQDTVGGLQVQREDGRFHDVPPLPGAFVVNLGELLEVATNGYLLATNHRVVSPPGATERFSVPFFYNPRLDARIEPLPFPYAAHAPGATADPANPLFAEYGRNELKGKLRAHPAGRRPPPRGPAAHRALRSPSVHWPAPRRCRNGPGRVGATAGSHPAVEEEFGQGEEFVHGGRRERHRPQLVARRGHPGAGLAQGVGAAARLLDEVGGRAQTARHRPVPA